MKRLYTLVMLLSVGSVTFSGCFSGRKASKNSNPISAMGGTAVKTVATVVGLILLSKLLKSVSNTVKNSASFTSLADTKAFETNFNENTPLQSLAKNDLTRTALQVLVAEHYQIPLTKVTGSYNSLHTAGDLAAFIGQNAPAKVLQDIK